VARRAHRDEWLAAIALSRREWLGAAGSLLAAQSLRIEAQTAAPGPIVTPEQFGAKGDGVTNDTAAFAAMADRVNQAGGGTVVLRPRTYIVGRQEPDPKKGYIFGPVPIMDFTGCRGPLTVHGNGARLRCADGLYFGTFDPQTGAATSHPLPYYKPGELAAPYLSMLKVEKCSGPVHISDLEFDGNIDSLRIGGKWGNSGWQIGCAGLRLKDNLGPVRVSNVNSHHHPQDGGAGNGPGQLGVPEHVTLENCRFSSNARNGFSLVGGVGWTFRRCLFEKCGRDLPFAGSLPLSGIDFEAEGGRYVADIHLVDCIASDNAGAGCLHPGAGRVSNVLWEGGRLIGTTNMSYRGGGNEGIRFNHSLFLGVLIGLSMETFDHCTFSDELRFSPTGRLDNPQGTMLPDARTGSRFVDCRVIHSRPEISTNGLPDQALFENCSFYSLPGAGRLDVYGHFRGSRTRFIAERGGADFAVTPGGRGGARSAGHAEDSFSVTTSDGKTVVYPPA
jgi:hypothetical protein